MTHHTTFDPQTLSVSPGRPPLRRRRCRPRLHPLVPQPFRAGRTRMLNCVGAEPATARAGKEDSCAIRTLFPDPCRQHGHSGFG
jgi:hypothetical protein